MSLLVTVFSHERPWHLMLMWEFLCKALENCPKADCIIIDDGSEDPEVYGILSDLNGANSLPVEVWFEDAVEGDGNARIGCRRGQAVQWALDNGYDYLLMLDDDILIGDQVLCEVLEDAALLDKLKIPYCSLALHLPVSIFTSMIIGGKLFSRGVFGGEANVMLPRQAMERWGEEFSSAPKGFGDNYFQKARSKGYQHLERSKPAYECQHIGIGVGGSIIHGDKTPFWVTQFYHNDHVGKLNVPGFDRNAYVQAISAAGAKDAPLFYLKNKKE